MAAEEEKKEEHGISPLKSRLSLALDKGIRQAWEVAQTSSRGESFWNFYSYLGQWVVSLYLVGLQLLGERRDDRVLRQHAALLLKTQLSDGSWYAIQDASMLEHGDLDATLWNHWFLALLPEQLKTRTSDVKMAITKSAEFIRQKGGIDQMNGMTKIWLAIGGQFPWSRIPSIPLFVFQPSSYLYAKELTAQWIYPHLLPIAFLSHINWNSTYSGSTLEYLWVNKPEPHEMICHQKELSPATDQIFYEILNIWDLGGDQIPYSKRQLRGSVGGYVPSTLLTVLAVHARRKLDPSQNPLNMQLQKASKSALGFLQSCMLPKDNIVAPYMGAAMDGTAWDSILVAMSLAIADEDVRGSLARLDMVVERLCRESVDANGGVGYGYGFLYAPDTDDTSMFVVLLSLLNGSGRYSQQIYQSLQWLMDHQNPNGGFPAFDHHKEGNHLWDLIFWCTGLDDAAEFTDPSCADITGHFLEAAGCAGMNEYNSRPVKRAISFLKGEQLPCGAWEGRWGVNYIYAVGAVLPGLRAVGYNLSEPWVGKSVAWLVRKQNSDGGFGESVKSYRDPLYAGKGISTITQTSWACLAFIAVREVYAVNDALDKAIMFLLDQLEETEDGKIPKDVSVVGTGHRHCVYMQYPGYPLTFSLIALKRYQNGML